MASLHALFAQVRGDPVRDVRLPAPAERRGNAVHPVVKHGDLDGLRGQVRAAYRLLRSRADVEDHLTARELLYGPLAAPELADAYDRARYSTHEISPEDAEAARTALTAARARR